MAVALSNQVQVFLRCDTEPLRPHPLDARNEWWELGSAQWTLDLDSRRAATAPDTFARPDNRPAKDRTTTAERSARKLEVQT